VNTWNTMDTVQSLIRGRTVLDPARLGDPSVPLADLPG